MNIMRKFADRTKGTGKLIDSELKTILRSVMKQLGDNRQAYTSVLHYIKNHPHLEIYVVDSVVDPDSLEYTFDGFYMPSTGRLYMTKDAITPDGEVFLHELLHSATQYAGVYDIITNVNNTLRALRKELEYDEGLAGQIYRASEPSEILTSGGEHSKRDVENALEGAAGVLGSAYLAICDASSDTGEGKAVPDFRKARRREDNIPIGENGQRERSRRLISNANAILQEQKITARHIADIALIAQMKADEPFEYADELMDTPVLAEVKILVAAMTIPEIQHKFINDYDGYKFMN